jgi:hypothetical protein
MRGLCFNQQQLNWLWYSPDIREAPRKSLRFCERQIPCFTWWQRQTFACECQHVYHLLVLFSCNIQLAVADNHQALTHNFSTGIKKRCKHVQLELILSSRNVKLMAATTTQSYMAAIFRRLKATCFKELQRNCDHSIWRVRIKMKRKSKFWEDLCLHFCVILCETLWNKETLLH